MSAPRWSLSLLRRLAPDGKAEDVLGDHEEAHERNVRRRGRVVGTMLTVVETLDMARALLAERRRRGASARTSARRFGAPVSWLDFKLGLRMLVRYPGLTLVGGLSIAFATWVGAGTVEIGTQALAPPIPLPAGDRLVGIRLYDTGIRQVEPRVLHDYLDWRTRTSTMDVLGAYRSVSRSLVTSAEGGGSISVAEMTASGFEVAGVGAHLGRTLTLQDEAPGATDVVVLGWDVWQTRFGGDPGVLGREVRLGRMRTTVVGVMPEGFAFPFAHQAWTPLRLSPLEHGRRQGPALQVFGRLAPDASLREARAEFAAFARQGAAAWPDTHERLEIEVLSYGLAALNLPPDAFREVVAALLIGNVFLLALIAVIASNVGLLVFARAAAREGELVVRGALGASRARIAMQLFVEALVLGGVGAAMGLAAAGIGMRWTITVLEGQVGTLPFWVRATISPTTVLYVSGLTVVGAAIAGIYPAFKATRGTGDRLRQMGSGGGGLRFGGVWTAAIVTQVAAGVAFPAVAFLLQVSKEEIRTLEVGFDPAPFVAARVDMDREPPPEAPGDTTREAFAARYAEAFERLTEHLRLDPAIVDVTWASRLPKMYHPWNQIEVDGGALPPPDERGHRMGLALVDLRYFEVLGASVVAGRSFGTGDLAPDARTVIVNESFVRDVLGGRNPLGRRVRFLASEHSRTPDPTAPWHEIVGVVEDMGTLSGYGSAGIYRVVEAVQAYPIQLALRVTGDPSATASTLHGAVAAVDPALRVQNIIRLDDTARDDIEFYDFWLRLTAVVSAIALLLSLAGIHSIMSFTLSRRTREIGIRVALGSDPRRVYAAVLRRPLLQVGCGILVGAGFTAVLTRVVVQGDAPVVAFWPTGVALVAGYAVVMTGVCLTACMAPLRRAMRIEPTEALRTEG